MYGNIQGLFMKTWTYDVRKGQFTVHGTRQRTSVFRLTAEQSTRLCDLSRKYMCSLRFSMMTILAYRQSMTMNIKMKSVERKIYKWLCQSKFASVCECGCVCVMVVYRYVRLCILLRFHTRMSIRFVSFSLTKLIKLNCFF